MICGTCYVRVAVLRHALEGPVARLEVQVRRPVVGQVLGERAGGAVRTLGDVARRHRGVERVAAHDLVDVRRGDLAGVDQPRTQHHKCQSRSSLLGRSCQLEGGENSRVKPVDDDLGTSEPQHGGASAEAAAATAADATTEAAAKLGQSLGCRRREGEDRRPMHLEREGLSLHGKGAEERARCPGMVRESSEGTRRGGWGCSQALMNQPMVHSNGRDCL